MRELESTLETLANAPTLDGLHGEFRKCVEEAGFPHVSFLRMEGIAPVSSVWLHLPEAFVDAYKTNNWNTIDPSVRATIKARGAVVWDDLLTDKLPLPQRMLIDFKRSYDIHSGISIPLRTGGSGWDYIIVARDTPGRIDRREVPRVHAMATQAWVRYWDLVEPIGQGPRLLKTKDKGEAGAWSSRRAVTDDHRRMMLTVELAGRYERIGMSNASRFLYEHRWSPALVDLLEWGWVTERADDVNFTFYLVLTALGYSYLDNCEKSHVMRREVSRALPR